jgi:hypothetical protein
MNILNQMDGILLKSKQCKKLKTRFSGRTQASIKLRLFLNIAPCCLAGNDWHYRAYCLHLHELSDE